MKKNSHLQTLKKQEISNRATKLKFNNMGKKRIKME